MKAMMKKLGMNVESIEDVQSIIIKTPKGNYIFDSADVQAMTMQGTTTYQITGDTVRSSGSGDPKRRRNHGRSPGKRLRREGKRGTR